MRSVAVLTITFLVQAGTAMAASLPVEPEEWREAERIEFVYTAGDSVPKVNYLRAGRGEQQDIETSTGLDCSPTESGQSPAQRSRWIWDVSAALREPEQFAMAMRREHLASVYLQVPPDPEAFAPLVKALAAAGIRAYALDGEPAASDEPSGLTRVLEGVLAFNERHSPGFAGLEVDVEPYVRPGFDLREDTHYLRFVALLSGLRERRPAEFELSAVIPFWYSQRSVNGGNLVAAVLAQVDSLAIMAYRTTPKDIEALARPSLCLAGAAGKSVRVGLESTFLKDEEHYIVSRSRLDPLLEREGTQWSLPGGPADGVPVDERYTVPGKRLSFHGDAAGLESQLRLSLPYGAFAGWVVNGAP